MQSLRKRPTYNELIDYYIDFKINNVTKINIKHLN